LATDQPIAKQKDITTLSKAEVSEKVDAFEETVPVLKEDKKNLIYELVKTSGNINQSLAAFNNVVERTVAADMESVLNIDAKRQNKIKNTVTLRTIVQNKIINLVNILNSKPIYTKQTKKLQGKNVPGVKQLIETKLKNLQELIAKVRSSEVEEDKTILKLLKYLDNALTNITDLTQLKIDEYNLYSDHKKYSKELFQLLFKLFDYNVATRSEDADSFLEKINNTLDELRTIYSEKELNEILNDLSPD